MTAGVLTGSDAALTDQEKAMAAWARKVALGAQLAQSLPAEVRDAVTYGRPVAT
jgi:hypothetical protein